MKNKDLERITEVDFERGLVKTLRYYKAQMDKIIEMFNDIQYYKERRYKIYYYFNKKEKTYNYCAKRKEVGFRYEGNKT